MASLFPLELVFSYSLLKHTKDNRSAWVCFFLNYNHIVWEQNMQLAESKGNYSISK